MVGMECSVYEKMMRRIGNKHIGTNISWWSRGTSIHSELKVEEGELIYMGYKSNGELSIV